jgi:type IV secretory pathway VirB10-like protein
MIPKFLALGLLALGCVTAAAGGAYVAVRQNATPAVTAPVPAVPSSGQPVSETEAVVTPAPEPVTPAQDAFVPPPAITKTAPAARISTSSAPKSPTYGTEQAARRSRTGDRRSASRAADHMAEGPTRATAPPPVERTAASAAVSTPLPETRVVPTEAVRVPDPPAAPEREFEEVVIPASAVVGLQVDTPISTEYARVEDRVRARVTRDVSADGRVAIPAGSRVIGSVTMVERGGKMKERARLGVRFHTLVLADGTEVPLQTEAIYREGDSPSAESARKIGGAAVGGAILGAIMGGKKGAVLGGATGAAGGTAAVMHGDRNPATLPAGTVVTVRLTAPVGIEVEKK